MDFYEVYLLVSLAGFAVFGICMVWIKYEQVRADEQLLNLLLATAEIARAHNPPTEPTENTPEVI